MLTLENLYHVDSDFGILVKGKDRRQSRRSRDVFFGYLRTKISKELYLAKWYLIADLTRIEYFYSFFTKELILHLIKWTYLVGVYMSIF